MFGYLVACSTALSEEQMKRYKACYCGLCRCLKAQHGQMSRLTLNYDMTFLILLLNSLYEPKEEEHVASCFAHRGEKREYFRSEITEYAADMNVALAYLNLQDDWKDDGNVAAATAAAALKKEYQRIYEKYPRQCSAMMQSLEKLSNLERERTEDPDAAATAFGDLLGAVFVYKDDRWKDSLFSFGCNLGRVIYLMDACIDLEKDTITNNYNPFRNRYGKENASFFSSILKMYLSDAIREFRYLPLEKDADLMKNILCIGLWTQFDKKYQHQLRKEDDNRIGE